LALVQRGLVLLLLTAILAVHVPALADDKADALKHFEIGLELVKQEAWDAALAEFLESKRLFPTKNALKNAAVCLRELKRWDEALDMYDELLGRFGKDLSADDRKLVDDDMAKLAKFVGTIVLATDVAGARVVIDGRERGVTPLPKGLRVPLGTRSVSVSKEGYAPFDTKVQVSSGSTKTVTVTLAAVGAGGKLKVVESTGAAVDVVIDGAVIGKTPWEGTLTAGTHTISLRASKSVGTIAAPVIIVANQSKELTLTSAPLPATIHFQATPDDAELLVDDKVVAKGGFSGPLSPGDHVLGARRAGYFDERKSVKLAPGSEETFQLSLSPGKRFVIELVGGALTRSFRGEDPAALDRDRSGFTAIFALRGGYRIAPWLAFDVGVGFAGSTVKYGGTAVGLASAGPGYTGESNNGELGLAGPLAAVGAAASTQGTFVLLGRVALGAFLPRLRSQPGEVSYRSPTGERLASGVGDVAESIGLVPVIMPEVRAGLRLSRSFTVDLGLAALVMFLPEHRVEPQCVKDAPVCARSPGLGGGPALVFTPSLGVRVDL